MDEENLSKVAVPAVAKTYDGENHHWKVSVETCRPWRPHTRTA